MASQGPLYPGTVTTQSILPEDDNDWINPGNVAADDGAEAVITAATYDANDISFRLKAQNFGFTIPAGATIDGITVEIEQDIAAGGARDERVQLLDAAGALVGANKATATAWPSTPTIASYGGVTDTWTASPTEVMLNDPDFGVVLSVFATAANTDIGADFIRVTVTYTEAPLVVTPGTAALTTATFAPTVTASDHQTVTPTTAALTLAAFAPSVTVGVNVVPTTASLALTAFAPTVPVTEHQTVTPTTAALSLTAFAPTITATDHQLVTPTTASLSLTGFAPTVTATANQVVTPDVAALTLSTFAPTVSAGGGVSVTPDVASLSLTAFAPNVVLTDHKLATPGAASLALTAFAPSVTTSDHQTVTPNTAVLSLTTYAPTVSNGGSYGGHGPACLTVRHPVPSVSSAHPMPVTTIRHPVPIVSVE